VTRSTPKDPLPPLSPDEEALVARARADRQAFAELYDRYFSRIYAFVRTRSATRADAEDVTSETFRRALAAIAEFEWRGLPFSAWLYRIAANALADHHRKSKRRSRHEPAAADPEGGGADPERLRDEERLASARFSLVFDLVERLPDAQRQVIRLRFGEGLSIESTASALGRSAGAVKQLQHRAVSTLRVWASDGRKRDA
jgi:RNA polymerase sigma-70 factor (ECF subfamily)